MNGVRSKLGQNRSYTDNSGGGGEATKGKKRFLKAHVGRNRGPRLRCRWPQERVNTPIRRSFIARFLPLLLPLVPPCFRILVEPVILPSRPKSSRFPKENTIFIVSGRTPNFSSLNPPSSPTNFTVIDSHSALFEDRERTPIPKRFLHVVCQGKGLPDTIYACVFQRRKSASRILPRIFSTKGER